MCKGGIGDVSLRVIRGLQLEGGHTLEGNKRLKLVSKKK